MDKVTHLISMLEAVQSDNVLKRTSTVDALLTLEPEDKLDRLDRIHFLLEKIKLSHERGSLSRNMVETIINDINILCSLSDLSKIQEIEEKTSKSKTRGKTEKLIECCYSSKASKPFTDEELLSLRSQARAYNGGQKITGFLAYDDESQSFFQILEGPEKAVQNLMSKIITDTRHSSVVIRFQVKIKERSYSDWSMSLVTLSEIKSAIAHVDELDDWLSNELFISKDIPHSKSRAWLSGELKNSYAKANMNISS